MDVPPTVSPNKIDPKGPKVRAPQKAAAPKKLRVPQPEADQPKKDLIDSVREDIPKTGFVSEMLVTAVLAKAGWTALDHAFYMDKDESKGREIDTVAIKAAEAATDRKKVVVTLALAVEVKKAESKPWVLFTSPFTDRDNVETLFDTSLLRMNLQEIWFRDLYSNHPVTKCGRFGRIAYQAFRNKKAENVAKDEGYSNDTFAALASCFKASKELAGYIKQGEQQPLRDQASTLKTYGVGIVHGLVVVDGRLFEAKVRDRQDMDVSEVHWLPHLFNYASKEYGGAHRFLVDVVTLQYLPIYLETYSGWLEERARFCLEELA